MGLQRSILSAMLQFVFFCEKVSVAAANNETSVELADRVSAGSLEDVSSGLEVEVIGPRP